MILSPYRNPPYRTPTSTSSISPPPGPSPKRKRADSQRSTTALHIDTTEVQDFAPQSGAESPRTNVAERLHGLNLQHERPLRVSPLNEPIGVPHKRLKRNQPLQSVTPGYELEAKHVSTPESSSQPAAYSRTASPIEIDEIPECRSRVASTPPLSPVRSQGFRQAWDLPVISGNKHQRATRLPSPSPPTPFASPSQGTHDEIDPAGSPMRSNEDASFDQIALTWQDDEITGHDIDLTSPDDDGLGINGIGFKPTAAMAYARSQKRKQQVNEWRAREARDARQKRFERRRGTSGAGSRGDPSTKRNVRFEGVG